TLMSLARNFGEHNAVMAGLQQARGAHVVTMDDDPQNPPDEAPRLLAHAQATGKHAVSSRLAVKDHARGRNVASGCAHWSAGSVLEKPRDLYLSSFACMSACLVAQVLQYTGPFPYVDGLILQSTRSIGEIAVQHLPRAHGRSNYTPQRLVRLWTSMF